MKALVFHKPKHVSVDDVEDPKILDPQDIIVRVTSTAICGSDLHIYNGFLPQTRPLTLGHEFMGIVEETGFQVKNVAKGDRVLIPCSIACGSCFFCTHDLPAHCEKSNPRKYGPEGAMLNQKGGGIFGYTDLYGGYAGGQAEFVRVPFANFGPYKIDNELSDEQVLFITDIFATGYAGIVWAGVKGGETVAVFGCGPVGLMAQKAAWLRGAKRVIGIDIRNYRLVMAEQVAGVEAINANDEDPVKAIREMTQGRGADVCVDAVGLEGDRNIVDKIDNIIHAQTGTIKVLKMCVSAVRRGGFVSVIGVYGMPYDGYPLGQIFDKGIKMAFGQAPVHAHMDDMIRFVRERKVRLDDIITHRMPLAEAPHAYKIFCDKEDNCVKVVMKP
jgi:threonine dehydrogenase-like Zn-dependent dehydrogenase